MTGTEILPGRVNHIYIGYDANNKTDIDSGIVGFRYRRVHLVTPRFVANTKIPIGWRQGHSHFEFRLLLLSDCRTALYTQPVTGLGGNPALVDNGDSNVIGYLRVLCPIKTATGEDKTRTYVIDNAIIIGPAEETRVEGYEDVVYTYSGLAYFISYSDS